MPRLSASQPSPPPTTSSPAALTPVLYGYRLSSYLVSAVYPTTQRYSVKVKLFVDFIQEKFAGEPPWDHVLKINGFLPHDDVTGEASPRLANAAR